MADGKAKSWFSAKANAAKGSAEIAIFNDIGQWGVSTSDFHDALRGLGAVDTIDVVICSDGGDVSTGFAIYDMLSRHEARICVRVVGLAASMASVIAMAGDEVVMPSNAMLMIHNPWGSVMGESDEIRNFANALDMMEANIRGAYIARTGLSRDEVIAMMDAETWLTAEKAVELGFADRVDSPVESNAKFHLDRFNKVPSNLRAQTMESDMTTKPDTAAPDAAVTTPAASDVATIRTGILAAQKEIRSLCKIAGKAELADGFIDADKSVSDVLAELDKLRDEDAAKAANGGDTINTRHRPNAPAAAKVVDTTDIYARFNAKR